LLYFSLFTDTNKKGCDCNTRLERSLTGQIKITHNISGCPVQFGMVGNPTCTYVITYLSVQTLAITSASSRCMHRLTIKLAAHFPYLTMITHGLTVPESHTRASSRSFFLFLFSAPD